MHVCICICSSRLDLEQTFSVFNFDSNLFPSFRDTVYCRYLDHVRRETGEAFKSIVFPEYTVYCPVCKEAQYMSLSNTLNETIQHSVPIVSRTQKGIESRSLEILRDPPHFFHSRANTFFLDLSSSYIWTRAKVVSVSRAHRALQAAGSTSTQSHASPVRLIVPKHVRVPTGTDNSFFNGCAISN